MSGSRRPKVDGRKSKAEGRGPQVRRVDPDSPSSLPKSRDRQPHDPLLTTQTSDLTTPTSEREKSGNSANRPASLVLLGLLRFSGGYSVLCLLYAIAIYLAVPVLLGLGTQAFFDAVAGEHTRLSVWTAVAVIAGTQMAEAMSDSALLSPWSSMQQKAHALMRRNLFAGILDGYGRHGLREASGEIVTRFRDDPELIADTLDAFCDLVGRSLFAGVAFFVMWRISPEITVVLFGPLLLCAFVTHVLGQRIKEYRRASRVATGRVSEFLTELLAAQLAVKVGAATGRAVSRLEELGDARRRAEVRDTVFRTMLEAFDVNLGNAGVGVVLLLAAQGMRAGTFTVGDLALFVVYLDALTWYPEEISRLLAGLKQIQVSLGRMHDVVPDQPPRALSRPAPVYLKSGDPWTGITAGPRPRNSETQKPRKSLPASHTEDRNPLILTSPPVPAGDRLESLEVRGLTYNHPGVVHGIVDVSFRLQRGTLTAITGRIGTGKTTLLQVLLGLLPRDAGTILWNGAPVEEPAAFLLPPRSAYVPQVPHLFSWTVRENILLGFQADEGALQRATQTAVLEPDVATLSHGLDTLVGPRGLRLSGGQIQRVAAARAFIRQPELLVLDDLSSALDVETEAELWRRLFSAGDEATYLVVSHRAAVLERADQVLVMETGRIMTAL